MSKHTQPQQEINYTGLSMGLGMLFGTALGIVLWLSTDSFVFFPVFVGAGLSIGLAIGAAKDEEK